MAPAASTHGGIQAPFLTSGAAAHQPRGLQRLVQRLAARGLPDPSAVLLACLALAGCCFVADRYVTQQHPRGESSVLSDVAVLGQGPAAALEGDTDLTGAILGAVVAVVGLLALLHGLVEKAAEAAVVKAAARLGLTIKIGRARTWLLLGHFEARNAAVLNPTGCVSDHALHVRVLSFDFSVSRLFLSFGRDTVIHSLNVDGLGVVVERRGSAAGTNLGELAEQVQKMAKHNCSAVKTTTHKVTIQNVEATVVGGRTGNSTPSIRCKDLPTEVDAGSIGMTLCDMLRQVEKQALELM